MPHRGRYCRFGSKAAAGKLPDIEHSASPSFSSLELAFVPQQTWGNSRRRWSGDIFFQCFSAWEQSPPLDKMTLTVPGRQTSFLFEPDRLEDLSDQDRGKIIAALAQILISGAPEEHQLATARCPPHSIWKQSPP